MKKILLFIGISALLAVSCGDDYDQEPVLPGGTAVSISEAEFHPVGGEYVMAVTMDSKWSISGIPDWLTIMDSKGKTVRNNDILSSGTRSFTLKAGINDEHTGKGTSRSSTLLISSQDGTFSETVKVGQDCPYLVISARKPEASESRPVEYDDEVSFDWNYTDAEPFASDEVVFTIECNTDFSITRTDAESHWLRVQDGDYKENKDKKYSVPVIPDSYNITGDDRSTIVEIEGPEGPDGKPLDKYSIDFSQRNLRFVVEAQNAAGGENINFPSCHTEPVSVRVDSEIDWEVDNSSSWVVFDPEVPKGKCDENSPESYFTVNVSHKGTTGNANPTRDTQNATFVVNGIVGKTRLPYAITVNQEPYELALSKSTENIGNFDTSAKRFDVTSSGEWEVSAKPSWIDIDRLSGNAGETTLSFNAPDQNLNLTQTVGTITVSSLLNSFKEDITVTHAPFVFQAEASNKSLNTLSVDKYALDIKSSGEWAISVSYPGSPVKDWLAVSAGTGSGNASITYNAKEPNTYEVDRSALISIKSLTHEKAGKSIDPIEFSILQRKYVFEVNPSPVELPLVELDPVYAKEYTVDVECSADWTVQTSASWILAGNKSRTSNGTVFITAENNYSLSERTGTVTIRSEYNGVVKEHVYNVRQKPFIFSISNLSFIDIPPVPETRTYETDVHVSAAWTIDNSGAVWIVPSPASGNGGESAGSVLFRVDNNLAKSSRTGTVTVRSTLSGHSQEVTFSQLPFEFDESPENFVSVEALNTASKTVGVTCSAGWSLVGLPDWIKADRTSGTGNASFTITPGNNYDLAQRNADFVVKSNLNSFTKPVHVSQKAFVFDTENVELPHYTALAPGSRTVVIGDCIGTWNLRNVPAWIKASTSSGEGNTSITFTAEENYDKARSAVIRIESRYIGENSSLCKLVEVYQDAFTFDTGQVELDTFAALDAAGATVTMHNTMSTWTVENDTDWVEVTPVHGTENGTVTIRPKSDNYETSVRTGTIRIVSDKNPGLSKVINASQAAFVFDVASVTIDRFTSMDGESKTVALGTSMSTWTVRDKPDWLNVIPMNGNGSAVITVTAENNVQTSVRNGSFRIVSDKNPSLSKLVNVSQDAFVFDVTSVTVPAFSAMNAEPRSVTLGESQSGWTVQDKPDWLTVSPMRGNGSMTVAISAENNVQTSERRGTFRIVSDENSSLAKVFSVSQLAYELSVSVSRLEFDAVDKNARTLQIGCSGYWVLAPVPDWIDVKFISGNELSITVTENEGAERNAELVFRSVDNESVSVVVTVIQKEKIKTESI